MGTHRHSDPCTSTKNPKHFELRPPPLSLGVFPPRRSQPPYRPRPPGQGIRDAGPRPYRSWVHVRRLALSEGGPEGRHHADHRHGGLRRPGRSARSDPGRKRRAGLLPPRLARPRHGGLPQPREALLHRVHRGVLSQTEGRPRGPRGALQWTHRLVGVPRRGGVPKPSL